MWIANPLALLGSYRRPTCGPAALRRGIRAAPIASGMMGAAFLFIYRSDFMW